MGFTHYSSNLLAANHVIAGIKNVYTVAILNSTYGKLVVADGEAGAYSGVQINQRVDFNVKAWNNTKTCLSTNIRQPSPAMAIEELWDIGEAPRLTLDDVLGRVIPREPLPVGGGTVETRYRGTPRGW